MAEPLTLNTIERLARAIFAQLSPMTGARAAGSITVTATGSGNKSLPPNAYLLPVVGGSLREDLVFKTGRDPDTVAPNGTGGAWAVNGGSSASVAITSNVGGARHNLAAGTVLRFDPPVQDFEPTATVDADLAGGADDATQLLRRLAFFEEIDASNPQRDIFAAMLADYPAAMLVWAGTEPAEGMTAGLRQGSTRGARKVRFMRETFVLYLIVGRLASDAKRRQTGIVTMQAATRLLSDRQCNVDGETLSAIGAGLEVVGRDRLSRGQRHYIYSVALRANQVLRPIDERTFNVWATTTIGAALPGRTPPEPTAPLPVVDFEQPMP